MTLQVGYALSAEEHTPLALVENARRAEEAGFEFALVSDHFHPWVDEQGHSPFVWSVLGGIALATEKLRIGTGVTCPLIRIHPAILAQAAATAAAMLPGRFFFGVGTGENLNEHVLGDRWPPTFVRREMLREAIEIMRELWRGDLTSHRGPHYTVENARLYTLPDEPIEVMVAAGGPEAAELAGEVGDGLVIDSVGLEVTEDHGAGAQAREAAFHDARERAAALARMAGAGLGSVQTIVEGTGGDGPSPMPKPAMMRDTGGGLEPGETSVTTTVTVVWELSY